MKLNRNELESCYKQINVMVVMQHFWNILMLKIKKFVLIDPSFDHAGAIAANLSIILLCC